MPNTRDVHGTRSVQHSRRAIAKVANHVNRYEAFRHADVRSGDTPREDSIGLLQKTRGTTSIALLTPRTRVCEHTT